MMEQPEGLQLELLKLSRPARSWVLELVGRAVAPAICTWVYDGDYSKWDTDCGEAFELSNDATLIDNRIQFCPFCGKRINEVA